MLKAFAIALLLGFLTVCAPAEASDSYADEIARIESAYGRGLAEAETPREKIACAQLRIASLAWLVDMTYQSTLSWLAERADLLAALERDQGEWMTARDRLVFGAAQTPDGRMRDYGEAANFMLERLAFFARVTADGVFTVENWG